MKCGICQGTEVIRVLQPDKVKFICQKGHKWTESYIDNGGRHQRPENYQIELDDILFPKEKIIYQKILKEIDRDKDYYYQADSEEKIDSLIKNCQIDAKDLYMILKKVEDFNNHKIKF